MGFEKSDADPNLYYIVVSEDPLILVLYVDDLLITREENIIEHYKRYLATKFEMIDIGPILFSGVGDLAYLPRTRQVRILRRFHIEEYDHQLEVACFQFQVSRSHFISPIDQFIEVFGQYHTRYLFHNQYIKLVHGGAQEGALGGWLRNMCCDPCKVQWIMDWTISSGMESG